MEFKKYQHVERVENSECNGLLDGTCYVFPKIDGTNASVWCNGKEIQAGSRKRHLSLEADDAEFYATILNDESIKKYLVDHPTHRLLGEWLVPHSLKTYREDAWKKFYIFDIVKNNDENGNSRHIPYNDYKEDMESYGLNYISPIAVLFYPNEEDLYKLLKKNIFLIEDGKGSGEGIIVKNYGFVNKYGRQTWGKIVASEFKTKHSREMGSSLASALCIEEVIVNKFITEAFIKKEQAKILQAIDERWESKYIPRLLHTVYHEMVVEEVWNFVNMKKYKNPTINFGKLQKITTSKIKELKPKLFLN